MTEIGIEILEVLNRYRSDKQGNGQAKPRGPSDGGPSAAPGLNVWDAGDDTDLPPPRGWLLGNTFCRCFLSSLFGDGGVGKTAVRYAQALALVTGRPLTGEHVFLRARVLIVSLEDDAAELRRRILAARLHYNISAADVRGWLFLSAPGAKAGKLMVTDPRGRPLPGQLAANLEAEIVAHNFALVSWAYDLSNDMRSMCEDIAEAAAKQGLPFTEAASGCELGDHHD